MLLRKQASYSDAFHARMQFSPRKAGYEAGLVLWWSCFSYAAIGITRVELQDGNEELQVVARRPTGVAGKVEVSVPAGPAQRARMTEVLNTDAVLQPPAGI